MKELRLVNSDRIAVIDDEDFERLAVFQWYRVGATKLSFAIYRYVHRNYKTKGISLASEIMHQSGSLIDHIDRNPLNNQKSNLRLCSHLQNSHNREKRQTVTSKYKGVYWFRQKWYANISCNGKRIIIGKFDKEEDAAKAYDKKAIELFKEFAYLNFK